MVEIGRVGEAGSTELHIFLMWSAVLIPGSFTGKVMRPPDCLTMALIKFAGSLSYSLTHVCVCVQLYSDLAIEVKGLVSILL